tara:strand:+ start:316 stop:465 length:150 start_codon:yes stop_codon:yes gene_type:complete
MKELIMIHFIVNITLLFFYIKYKQEKITKIWKEVTATILFGWIVLFIKE